MKQFILLFLLIVALYGKAQISTINENSQWNIGMHCISEEPINMYDYWYTNYYYFMGDSVINDVNYRKLVCFSDSLHTTKLNTSIYREENRKVYKRSDAEDYLLFDFNLQANDSLIIQFNEEDRVKFFIRIDSVKQEQFADEIERTVQYVSIYDYYNSELGDSYIYDTIVEGIGSLSYGLSYPMTLFSTGGTGCFAQLLCYHLNDELVYTNPNYNTCNLSTGIRNAKQNENLIMVNPIAQGMLLLQPLSNTCGRITFFILNGKVVSTNEVSEVTELQLSVSGMLLYRYETDNGSIQSGKLMLE